MLLLQEEPAVTGGLCDHHQVILYLPWLVTFRDTESGRIPSQVSCFIFSVDS